MLRIALITNHPPPFRIPVFEKIGTMPGIDLEVVFCSAREPNRQWELPPLNFKHTFLRERFVARGSNFIHNNPDVIPVLRRIAPDVIVTSGFNPTYLYAFGYAMLRGIPHVPMTDGTDVSEQTLSGGHRLVRRLVYARSRAFISASFGGRRLYQAYRVPMEHWFQSCLCIDNDAYLRTPEPEQKIFDFIFCGRIVHDKNPLFALQVASATAQRLGRKTSILFVGDGEQDADLRQAVTAGSALVDAEFNGHAQQHQLPDLYRSARIFLFPTSHDVWGVVANEACAAGLPVLVTPHAGVTGELVLDGQNGFICELDADLWAERAARLLTSTPLLQRFAHRSSALVGRYTFDHAAAGIVDACHHAAKKKRWQSGLRQRAGKAG
jgi:glycosyltransferase involved in cell wall biosynthesis